MGTGMPRLGRKAWRVPFPPAQRTCGASLFPSGKVRSGPPAGAGLQSEIWDLCWLLEVDDETGRDAGAIDVRAGGVEADVIHLGAEGQMRKQADIHTTTKTIGKLVGRAAARSDRDARAAKEYLPEWIDFGGVAQRQARTEEIGVGVYGNAGRRCVVAPNVTDEAEPAVGVIGEGATDAVLVEAVGASQAEIRIAERGINGLSTRGDGENGQR